MNSDKTDYSFTDPTWKLPSIGNPTTMHSDTYDIPQLPPESNLNNDVSTWNNQTNNSRYIPPNPNRAPYPPINPQEQGEYFSESGPYLPPLPPTHHPPAPPPTQPYRQPEEQFFQSGAPPPTQPYRQPEEQFFQPGPPAPSQYYRQPEEQFFQPGPPPPPPQPYRQPEEQFFQSVPPVPPSQSYQQSAERIMQARFPPSHPQVGDRSLPPPPPPPPQSYQQSRERFMQQNPPPPHSQSFQQPSNQYRNTGNSNDNFNFTANINTNEEYDSPKQQRHHGYSNEQKNNHGHNFPPLHQSIPRRSQNVDHNHQAFFTDYAPIRENHLSHSHINHSLELNQSDQKTKSRDHSRNDDTFDSIDSRNHRPNKTNIHDYLYGLAVPDSGSYVKTFKNQRRLVNDERVNHRGVMNEYKNFVQNGGFGPTFGAVAQQTYQEKLAIENKKKSYSKQVRAINQQKIEDQMRMKNSGEQLRNRTYASPVIQHRRPHELTSHFLFTPEVKEFERKIKRDHDANCKCSLHARPFNSSA